MSVGWQNLFRTESSMKLLPEKVSKLPRLSVLDYFVVFFNFGVATVKCTVVVRSYKVYFQCSKKC